MNAEGGPSVLSVHDSTPMRRLEGRGAGGGRTVARTTRFLIFVLGQAHQECEAAQR